MQELSKKERKWITKYDGFGKRLEPFLQVIEQKKKETNNAKELEEMVRDYYLELFVNYIDDLYEISGVQFQLRLSNYYKEHQEEIKPLFELVKSGKTEIKDFFIANFKEASKTFMRQMIGGLEEELDACKVSMRDKFSKSKVNVMNLLKVAQKSDNFRIRMIAEYVEERLKEERQKRKEERKSIDDILQEPIQFSEKEITEYIKGLSSLSAEYLKEKYMQALLNGKKLLQEIGAFPLYITQYNRDLKRIGIGEAPMLIDIEGEGLEKIIDEILPEERLEKCSLEELNLLNIFWQNRIAKEVGSVSNMLYVASHTHMYQKAIMGEEIEEPSVTDYERAMKQKAMLDSMIQYSYEHAIDLEKGIYDQEYRRKIPTKQIEYANEDRKERRYLMRDIDSFEDWYYIQKDCYGQKNNLIYQLITELNENHNLKNWGVKLEEKQGENMLIEVDYPGYNLPCMFHVNQELVRKALSGMRQKTVLPIYEGDSDRNISIDPDRKQVIPCNLLLPVSREQRKYLKAKRKELKKTFLDTGEDQPYSTNYKKYKMIDHMIAIAEGDYPEHLKERHFENNRILYTRGRRRYIDMKTRKIYEKNENGKLELAERGR